MLWCYAEPPLLLSQASSTPVIVSRTDHHTRDGGSLGC